MTAIENKENKSSATVWMGLLCLAGLQGCVSTGGGATPAARSKLDSPVSKTVAVSKEMFTVENLLSWPLEGPGGADKVIAGLQQVYKMTPTQDGYRGDGPAVLADNYVLSFASVRKLTGVIHIGLQEAPCFQSAQAAALIGAIADPATNDAHGVDRGKTFEVTQNGVMVYFNTTAVTYRCVTSIHIRTIQKIS